MNNNVLHQRQKPYYAREWKRLFYLATLADNQYHGRVLDQMVCDDTTRRGLLELHDSGLQGLVDTISDVSPCMTFQSCLSKTYA